MSHKSLPIRPLLKKIHYLTLQSSGDNIIAKKHTAVILKAFAALTNIIFVACVLYYNSKYI